METLRQHVSTLQFLMLAITFLLPILVGLHVPGFDDHRLGMILVFEFGAIVAGFFFLGFSAVPFILIQNPLYRYIALALIGSLVLPLGMTFQEEYGWLGLLGFLYLVLATYCASVIGLMSDEDRLLQLAEIGLRWVVYMVLFSALGEIVPTTNVARILEFEQGYYFGAVYFGLLAFMDWRRWFPRAINILFALFHSRYHRPPRPPALLKNDTWRGYPDVRHTVQQWYWFMLLGVFLLVFVLVFLRASIEIESAVLRWLLWAFLVVFAFLPAAALLAGAFTLMWRWLKAKQPWLELQACGARFTALGFVPRYLPGRTQDLTATLQSVTAGPVDRDGDVWQVDVKNLHEFLLTQEDTSGGTTFHIDEFIDNIGAGEQLLRLRLEITEQENGENHGVRDVWAVQFPLVPGKAAPAHPQRPGVDD